MRRKTLYLIDSQTNRRAAICHALAGRGVYVAPFETVQEIKDHWPPSGVVLVEDADGHITSLLEFMAGNNGWLPLIGFSEQPGTQRVARAVLDGALGYLDWPCTAAEMEQAIEEAEANAEKLGSFHLRQARARSRIQTLTRREHQVLDAITEGLSNREIGERLEISPRTVEIHRSNMLNKVGASHTSEAIRIAIEATLVA
ncbi:MAG: DNA-binding response regulator [Novosphingobium sp.]|nr:DNA-binding response regulator [Novosphingobium sp.]